VGREYWPQRANLHLPDEIKLRTLDRLKADFPTFLGRRVKSLDRTDGLKMKFADGSWVLLRLSGTEPLLRVYTEAATPEESSKIAAETEAWVIDSAQEAKA
jgi:phosphomannomutase